MQLLFPILLIGAIIIALLLSKWNKKTNFHPWAIPAGFIIKCAVGIVFLSMYPPEKHLENDGAAFLYEGKILHEVFYESPGDYFKLLTGIGENDEIVEKYLTETAHWSIGEQRHLNDSKNVIRLHSIFYFLSGDDTYSVAFIALIIFSLLCIVGIALLTLSIQHYSRLNPHLIFSLLLLTPSILFWSSSILKEPLLIFGLGVCTFGLLRESLKYRHVYVLAGIIILLLFKSYVVLFVSTSILFYWVHKSFPKLKTMGSFAVLFALGIITSFLFNDTVKTYTEKISRKQFDFMNIGKGGLHVDADSCFFYFSQEQLGAFTIGKDSVQLIESTYAMQAEYGSMETPIRIELTPQKKRWAIQYLNPRANSLIPIPQISTPIDLVKAAPSALKNVFLRPYPWDPGSKLNLLATIENILFFLVVFYLLKNRDQISSKQWKVIGSISFSLLLLALSIGWITPVLGAIIRYKIPIQIGVILILAIVYKPQKEIK